ncbi:hypothetical protein CC1G_13845 [Coprinopsis cinerea okayama7|uniref:Uncharacterized protein n=1 Tax=Coprinopsis cinerea (strain Okayama-7 / 130 / ATCC MYA-4618 / FGSC 9003) TaxID=240176 RepID=D6RKK7_COPC7|nr:hypothetical protein CC1G_13845 [Coprinopsis cinerea okayama7\|eukprot:XP_002911810.1 hypothetical protein CC1G_13845 [Coprinopsis cinerea okayama7\
MLLSQYLLKRKDAEAGRDSEKDKVEGSEGSNSGKKRCRPPRPTLCEEIIQDSTAQIGDLQDQLAANKGDGRE